MSPLDLFRLDDRAAIVTGGGRGLGQFIAEALADAGSGVMIGQGRGGRIVNIASVAALLGSHPAHTQVVGYAASKGAVVAMTRELATSWARYGITVNALAPGWFPTKMSRAVLERNEEEM